MFRSPAKCGVGSRCGFTRNNNTIEFAPPLRCALNHTYFRRTSVTKIQRISSACSASFFTMEGLEDLELLSLVQKITIELSNHLGM